MSVKTKSAKTNRQYKSSIFANLFGEKDKMLELYNAIHGTNYAEDTPIRITTLENVLFNGIRNDVSFMIEDRVVVLVEHQSTINPNMPLRMLQYMVGVYMSIIDNKDMYKELKMTIPRPEFIVLYNGKDYYPDRQSLKLSDMFVKENENYPLSLELYVEVYNINKGHNPQFAERSETLNGYEIFVAAVNENPKSGMSRDKAIGKAISDCIDKNILREYLKQKGAEVMNMMLGEWKMKDALKVREEEGILIGMRITARNMLAEGMDVDTVARMTGLFVDDILRLQSE